jgi:Uncharacterized protein containing a NRPS condensation (elongation) domain
MEYRAEIFDQMQLLFDETGFNDHMLHCEARFPSRLDEAALRRALALSLEAVPILATRYSAGPGRHKWLSLDAEELGRAFAVARSEAEFQAEVTFRIDEALGPQIRLCLLEGDRSAIAITMNHMVADGAGFKDYLYFLAGSYSRLLENKAYRPAAIDGDRGIAPVMRAFSVKKQIGAFLAQKSESNRTGTLSFPFSEGGEKRPFIATRAISAERIASLKAYCKASGATINDAALAAYYRCLARSIGPAARDGLEVPIMIDMRRYLAGERFDSLRNLASTTVTKLELREGESFDETLAKAKELMDRLKRSELGLGGYAKMSLLFSICGEGLAFRLLRKGLRHPLVCMTNIGELDSRRFRFGDVEAESAYVCGSIKHKPHFQLALSSFAGAITLSTNLYGDAEDRRRVDAFLAEVANELEALG